jgi:hypothetical protein
MVTAQGLAAQWDRYRRALAANEPGAFSWVALGYRIIATATYLREQMGYEDDEPCYDLVAIGGSMYYGGRRGKRQQLLYRTCKRGFIPETSIPEPWDIDPFSLPHPHTKEKWYRKPRAIVEGNIVSIVHKRRTVPFKVCMTEQTAEMVAARINQKELPVTPLVEVPPSTEYREEVSNAEEKDGMAESLGDD